MLMEEILRLTVSISWTTSTRLNRGHSCDDRYFMLNDGKTRAIAAFGVSSARYLGHLRSSLPRHVPYPESLLKLNDYLQAYAFSILREESLGANVECSTY